MLVFAWASLPANPRIVDIGDALGIQSVILALEFPTFCYVIQDVEANITIARRVCHLLVCRLALTIPRSELGKSDVRPRV